MSKKSLRTRLNLENRLGDLQLKSSLLLAVIGLSFTAHSMGIFTVSRFQPAQLVEEKPKPIKVKVVEKKPPPPEPEPPKPVVKPKPKPPKPKPKPKKKKIVGHRSTKKKKPKKSAQPIQGVTKNSVVKSNKSGFSVPVGNTLMTEDKGIRKKPDEVDDLPSDLSSDAVLIRDSFVKPKYTDDALDVGLEGIFTVEVLLDKQGSVKEVEIDRKIGFGMDKLVKTAMFNARFRPRRNRLGQPEAGWASVSVRLTPN